ncbi:GNAT family N-acetyltransferase [Nonomuraea sp. NPDC049758]|uniref:GNAT family N-acetyltransferase n=1 Tax=Nonomuraea sp. NPDC049758 TaxID=3154360 RepID=UPI003442B09A
MLPPIQAPATSGGSPKAEARAGSTKIDGSANAITRLALHRRRGLGAVVVRELEREAARRGYLRIHLTTGPRQPEAVALYLAGGYTPRFDPDERPARGPLPFVKSL